MKHTTKNDYSRKTAAELDYIIVDAGEALRIAERNDDPVAISKYADQVNDAVTERYHREQKHKNRVKHHEAVLRAKEMEQYLFPNRRASKNLCTNGLQTDIEYHHI